MILMTIIMTFMGWLACKFIMSMVEWCGSLTNIAGGIFFDKISTATEKRRARLDELKAQRKAEKKQRKREAKIAKKEAKQNR